MVDIHILLDGLNVYDNIGVGDTHATEGVTSTNKNTSNRLMVSANKVMGAGWRWLGWRSWV